MIPGGTQLSAALDVARAMLRRAERRVVQLRDDEGLGSEVVLAYLNRASDLLFAMARFADEANPQLFEGRAPRARQGRRRWRLVAPPPAAGRATSTRSRSATTA